MKIFTVAVMMTESILCNTKHDMLINRYDYDEDEIWLVGQLIPTYGMFACCSVKTLSPTTNVYHMYATHCRTDRSHTQNATYLYASKCDAAFASKRMDIAVVIARHSKNVFVPTQRRWEH